MPYSAEAEYIHHRQLPQDDFVKNTFKTVSVYNLSKKVYAGKKFKKNGVKAVIGMHKYWHQWKVQSFLVPKGAKV